MWFQYGEIGNKALFRLKRMEKCIIYLWKKWNDKFYMINTVMITLNTLMMPQQL